jgi:hypothetical protein
MKMRKRRCRWRAITREWNHLEERMGFYCRNERCRCYPGLCIEDWRVKKVFCEHYCSV